MADHRDFLRVIQVESLVKKVPPNLANDMRRLMDYAKDVNDDGTKILSTTHVGLWIVDVLLLCVMLVVVLAALWHIVDLLCSGEDAEDPWQQDFTVQDYSSRVQDYSSTEQETETQRGLETNTSSLVSLGSLKKPRWMNP